MLINVLSPPSTCIIPQFALKFQHLQTSRSYCIDHLRGGGGGGGCSTREASSSC